MICAKCSVLPCVAPGPPGKRVSPAISVPTRWKQTLGQGVDVVVVAVRQQDRAHVRPRRRLGDLRRIEGGIDDDALVPTLSGEDVDVVR